VNQFELVAKNSDIYPMVKALRAFKSAKLSIIVPVFNEASAIVQNLDLLLDEVEGYFTNFEVIVVSDGSTDGTNAQIKKVKHPDLKPVFITENSGKGGAVRQGFKRASGDFILFIDGGMEIHPKEIRIFMGLMSLYECDIVIGSKRHPQSKVEYPWFRRLLSWMFQVFVRAIFQVQITDTQVGIKLFRREVIDAILPHLEINRYGFDLELLILAKRKGFDNVLEAPIRMDYFSSGKRHIARELFHVFQVGFSLIKDTLRLHARMKRVSDKSYQEVKDTSKRAG
jgi:glycosyltransferase involved in cell wall biosynthesis